MSRPMRQGLAPQGAGDLDSIHSWARTVATMITSPRVRAKPHKASANAETIPRAT